MSETQAPRFNLIIGILFLILGNTSENVLLSIFSYTIALVFCTIATAQAWKAL